MVLVANKKKMEKIVKFEKMMQNTGMGNLTSIKGAIMGHGFYPKFKFSKVSKIIKNDASKSSFHHLAADPSDTVFVCLHRGTIFCQTVFRVASARAR